jgi:CRISPR system Cascade subunit CasD
VVLRLELADEEPTLDAIARALDEPARPLFIGRKPCLPSSRVIAGRIQANTVLDAVVQAPPLDPGAENGRVRIFWPREEGTLSPERAFAITDRRNWRSGVHGGGRIVVEGEIVPAASAGSGGR